MAGPWWRHFPSAETVLWGSGRRLSQGAKTERSPEDFCAAGLLIFRKIARPIRAGRGWIPPARQSATNRRWPQDAFDDLSWVDGGYDPHLPLVSDPRAGSFPPGCAW